MAQGNFVAYFRVSTERQGRSGLGLEAQKQAVEGYLNGGRWKLVGEFTEVESGKRRDRPELQKAFAACRLRRATLVVAKLDRLARDAHFLLGLKDAGIDFVAVDMPSANRLTVGIMAMVAEEEARLISVRTKVALAAAKGRGTKLGNPANATSAGRQKGNRRAAEVRKLRANAWASDVGPTIKEIRDGGARTLAQIAEELNRRGLTTRRGGEWSPTQVQRIVKRLDSSPLAHHSAAIPAS